MSRGSARWAQRLWIVLLVLPLVWLWKTDVFGFAAKERTLIWRLPVSFSEMRRLELQVWDEESLLKREEMSFPSPAVAEPVMQVALKTGHAHRAIAAVWLGEVTSPTMFELRFAPGGDEVVPLEMKNASTSR